MSGCAGVGFTVTEIASADINPPPAFMAETVTSPLFDPTVAWIESLVELPLHPEGKVHVYEAPVTAEIP